MRTLLVILISLPLAFYGLMSYLAFWSFNLLMGLYAWFYYATLWRARNNAEKRKQTHIVFVLVLPALLFADHIAGQLYFNHLCQTKAGTKIYKTVDLPRLPEWEETPRYSYKRYDSEQGLEFISEYSKPHLLNIKVNHFFIKQNSTLLSEEFHYEFNGGRFARALFMEDGIRKQYCSGDPANFFDSLKVNGVTYDFNKAREMKNGNN